MPAASSIPRSTRPPAACTASASRSSTRCRTISRSRWRAAASSTASAFRAACRRASWRSSARCTTAAAPGSASIPTRRSSARARHFEPARLYRMARSKAYLFGGVEIRWTCDPALHQGQGSDAGQGGVPFPRRPEGLSAGLARRANSRSRAKSSPARARSRAATARSNGRSPGMAATASSTPTATPSRPREGGTHEAGLRNALTRGLQRLCRADRQQARRDHHHRRRDDLGRRHAVGVHPRAGIRRPDQGQAGDGRGDPHRRARRSAIRSTIGWPTIRRKPRSCSNG